MKNGHRYPEILEYTLSQFEAFAELTDKLLNRELARETVSAQIAHHAAPTEVQKYIESLSNG